MIVDKYVVFKAEDWQAMMSHLDEAEPGLKAELVERLPDPAHDAVVVRFQDVFASAGLAAYGYAVLQGIELADTLGAEMSEDERERLIELADYFLEAAAIAREASHKLPD